MKQIFLLFAFLFTAFPLIAQQKSYGFPEIGWSFTPPDSFKLLDSSSGEVKITSSHSQWHKRLMFKAGRNSTISCSISSGNTNEADWNMTRSTETRRSFEILRERMPELSFDSSASLVSIDGIEFQRFALTGRKDGQVKYSHIQLGKYYKGYKVNLVYMFDDERTGEIIENQLQKSKFAR